LCTPPRRFWTGRTCWRDKIPTEEIAASSEVPRCLIQPASARICSLLVFSHKSHFLLLTPSTPPPQPQPPFRAARWSTSLSRPMRSAQYSTRHIKPAPLSTSAATRSPQGRTCSWLQGFWRQLQKNPAILPLGRASRPVFARPFGVGGCAGPGGCYRYTYTYIHSRRERPTVRTASSNHQTIFTQTSP